MLTLCHLKRTDQPPNAASGLGVEPLVDGADRGHGVVTHRGFVERLGRPLAVLGTATRRSGSTSAGIVGAVNTHSDPEQFVTKFADFWNSPSPQGLPELLHPDVVLVQPLVPRMVGIEAAQAQFERFWYCLPDLRGDVDHWCGDGDLVFIEFRLRARIGGSLIEWPNVNRLHLRDGKGVERVTYFDPLAILPTLLRHPSIGWRWWRSGITAPGRSQS
jgi:ketosteroid isomerase-like protein